MYHWTHITYMIHTKDPWTFWRCINCDSYTIKLTWRLPNNRENHRKGTRWKIPTYNYWENPWQNFCKFWPNERKTRDKDLKRRWKNPLHKIPIQRYLQDLLKYGHKQKYVWHKKVQTCKTIITATNLEISGKTVGKESGKKRQKTIKTKITRRYVNIVKLLITKKRIAIRRRKQKTISKQHHWRCSLR